MENFHEEQYVSSVEPEYAGFWQRFAAFIIDGVILGIPIGIISVIIFAIFIGGSPELIELFSDPNIENEPELTDQEALAVFSVFFGSAIVTSIISLITSWLYFALLHSSKWQATLGKKMLGIKVTNTSGTRIRFGRATGRYFSKGFLSTILYIGYLLAAITEKKQALHDLIAGTIVVKED